MCGLPHRVFCAVVYNVGMAKNAKKGHGREGVVKDRSQVYIGGYATVS
ncbi:MAG: hypothetical protein UY74_C0006G0017 [Candidatus Kaiserbacteria bacterium GW2011_GWC2_52_8b]|uniref:Uncharacterized protein n=2 Tax=Candidatus Kaiseribacteriota TaxID=1752734 RepID=A0A0G1XKP3_9BACT|nr:MAG: hypothetical protein UY67_C0034G0018 [Candidatus Kaiserbacteria bacterium GW2011_GWA2_52_12]KKW31818.1 MAG: hypothetical protein UY74_C0006G0017 [Candidatus Kaiserbacteria bacterium GW2011_GWC2_52_8b]